MTGKLMTSDDEIEIRRLLQNWCLWRDTGDFERLRATYHDDGRMGTTWSTGSADEFVALARAAFEKGMDVAHQYGGGDIRIAGDRAIAHSRLLLSQRTLLHGVPCDIEGSARFFDFLERRSGIWAFVERQPIYDRDWIAPIAGGALPPLDPERLARFPAGYRYFGYSHSLAGLDVDTGLPGRSGPALDALYARGDTWLAG